MPSKRPRDRTDGRAAVAGSAPKFVGARVRRKEDPRLLSGRTTYADDVRLPHMAYAKLTRSTQAHARIAAIDATVAASMPGVIAVVTGDDLADGLSALPASHRNGELGSPPHFVLAREEVRHVGEAVAVVVAESEAQATDAVETILIDYEALPAVTDVEAATRDDTPLVHRALGTNVSFTRTLVAGDPTEAFASAPVVRRQRLVNQRLVPVALEARCVIADYDPGPDKLTVITSTQIPHTIRALLAKVVAIPEHRVRVIAPEVGGGFGAKANFYPEEPLLAYLSRRLLRRIKWTETRTEAFQATTHGRDQLCDLEVAADAGGRLLALRATIHQDLGAYHQLFSPHVSGGTTAMITGCYAVDHVEVTLKGVFTNKTPTDAYRGAGRPEATLIIERAMELIADGVGKDAAEVRRLNFIPADAFPFETAIGIRYDSGNYQGALDKLLANADYTALRAEQERARREGRLMGIGLCNYVEMCGFGPSTMMSSGGWETCEIEVRGSGTVVVKTGLKPTGQGEETAFAQIVADRLGVSLDDVEVIHGDTDLVGEGIGTFGSRGMAVGGSALMRCVDTIRTKARRIAAHLLEVHTDDVVFEDGKLHPTGAPAVARSFGEIARTAHVATDLPPDLEPGLTAVHYYEPTGLTFPFGAHLAVVEIDRETGWVTLKRHVAVDDCGTIINPTIVEGQVHGGIAQGVGQALFETTIYDEFGQLLTGSLMDYAVPKASLLPSFELDRTVTSTPVNPLGAKGIGEAGTIGSTPAVVNAVLDALRPYAMDPLTLPLTPERVWRALQQAAP